MHEIKIITMRMLILTLMCSCLFSLSSIAQTKKPAATAAKKVVPASIKVSIDRGKKVYADQCLTCHQADGGGVQSMNPPLTKTKQVLGDKTQLIQLVIKGMNTQTEINGDVYHNIMPPHDYMTDQQIADVLTYIRNSFGNKAKAITEAEVKAVRAKTK